MVNRLLLVGALRHMAKQPWQTWLSVVGIALGVAVIVAVDLANQSARQAFLLSAESLTGRATHQIVADGSGGIPEDFYRQLRVDQRLRSSAPLVEGLAQLDAETLQLVGVDPLAEAPFRQFGAVMGSGLLTKFMTEPGTVLLSSVTAGRLGLGAGDKLTLSIAGVSVVLHILASIDSDNPAALEGLILTDISTAQELLGRSGSLDRIDLILDQKQAEQLAATLPPGLRLEVPAARTQVLEEMIQAFQTNLSAMSLLALLVGAFLIYNSMTFSVLRRIRLLGTLRLLGVTRRSLFWLILFEASLLAFLGTAVGLLLGTLTAHYLVHLVTRTINDLYFVLTVTELIIAPLILLKGILAGVGVTLLASLLPALEAAAAPPARASGRSRLEYHVHQSLPWLAFLGTVMMLAGILLTRHEAGGLTGGFAGLFLLIFGYSLLIPLAVKLLTEIGRIGADSGGLLIRFALRGIEANLSRTGLSVAALSIAVASTLGVGIMITSFRATVSDWLDYTLRSDIYISASNSGGSGTDDILPPQIRSQIQSLDIVAETSSGRRLKVMSGHGEVHLLALDMATGSREGFRFLEPPAEDLWPRFSRGETILVSEPYAYRHGLHTGDALLLHTPAGAITLPIGAVFFDYGTDRGLVSLSRTAYDRHWRDTGFSTIGVFLQPGVDTTAALIALRRALQGSDVPLRIRSNREIRERSLEVFDRTFAITRVLRLLAIGVAFAGILSALMALQLERAREQAILRAMGTTNGQLARLTLLQTGTMGLYAGVLSLPLGWLMSEVLIDVINRRSFGWSIFSQLPASAVVEALLLAFGSALLAGLYPAWRMRRVRPALALREE